MIDLHQSGSGEDPLADLNNQLIAAIQQNDLETSRVMADRILKYIKANEDADEIILATSYYLTGIYFLQSGHTNDAIRYLSLASGLKEKHGEFDERYSKILYNLGVAYYLAGDFANQKHFSLASLEIEKKIYGESSPLLIQSCNLVAIACLGLQDYERSLEYSKLALNISRGDPPAILICRT